jgi:hypothetical protein
MTMQPALERALRHKGLLHACITRDAPSLRSLRFASA